MPRLILKLDSAEFLQLKPFLEEQVGVESGLLCGSSLLVNFTGLDEEYQSFLQGLKSRMVLESIRELCHGKCRDGSDCLNVIKHECYCRKHQPVGNRDVQDIHDVEGGREQFS